MKRTMSSIAAAVVLTLTATPTFSSESDKQTGRYDGLMDAQIEAARTASPLMFTRNDGQWDEKCRFRVQAGDATVWLAADGVCYQFARAIGLDPRDGSVAAETASAAHLEDPRHAIPETIETMTVRTRFMGATTSPRIVGLHKLEYECNYIVGNQPSHWFTHVPSFQTVVYEDLYDGIDLKYYGDAEHLEYDFIVAPGADISRIALLYEGAQSVAVSKTGELVITTPWGDVVEHTPLVYQVKDGRREAVGGSYTLKSDRTFGFVLCDSYDPSLPAVIDPILSYSTYLGGTAQDDALGFAVDPAGNAYVTGWTWSADYPTTVGAFQDSIGTLFDAFLTKLTPDGSALVFSTYFGGNQTDVGWGIKVDDAGNIYVTGHARSTDFPTTAGAYQPALNGTNYDIFVAKLHPTGDSLHFCTYVGGTGVEELPNIAIDPAGGVYVTGSTESTNYPTTPGAFQTAYQGAAIDAFAFRLSPTGSALVYSTYLGGNNNERGWDIAVDSSGNAYITGFTLSANFPTTAGAFQDSLNGTQSDAFVMQLNPSGTALVYSTLLGGASSETAYGIEIDSARNVYVTGQANSTDFPTTPGVYQPANNGSSIEAFITKLNPTGDTLLYSTFLGGTNSEFGDDIAIDAAGGAYIVGHTASANYPVTAGAFQTINRGGPYDGFMAKLSPSGDSLEYSTYIGGNGSSESMVGIGLDSAGSAYISGYTSSLAYPTTPGAFQTTFSGSSRDAVVSKFSNFGTGVGDHDQDHRPLSFRLAQNYPNPFNPSTTIAYTLSEPGYVTLEVFNVLGQRVATLIDRVESAGSYRIQWSGTDDRGVSVATGVYLYRLQTGSEVETRKMLLLK